MAVTETELQSIAEAAGGVRVTYQQVIDNIAGEQYLNPQGMLTICVLTLMNGFTVTGESACADPLIYKEETGRKLARENAINKIWPLMGYELKTKLALITEATPLSGAILSLGSGSQGAKAYIGTKVIYALPMNRQAYNDLRGWTVPEDEDPTDEGYLVQYADGGKSNLEGFTGYVSWSPKDVFEKAYDTGTSPKTETFIDRLEKEQAELAERIEKLKAFLGSPGFEKLEKEDQDDLKYQLSTMYPLWSILEKRLNKLR